MYYGRITYLRVNGQVLIDKEKNQSEAENRITPDWWIYQTSDGTYIVTWYHRAVLKADLGLKTLDSKGGDIMGRYKDLTLTVGVFFRDGTENTSQVQFKGWLLANGEEVTFATRDGAVRETEWQIYQTEDGKYLVYWFHWISAWGAPSVSDYVILDNFPVYDQTFVGTFLGEPVWDIPYHILDRAKAVLEGKEDYRPGI